MIKKILIPAFFILPVALVSSCGAEEKKKVEEEVVPQLIIGDPTNYGSDSLILFPVGMTSIPLHSGEEGYSDDYDNSDEAYATEEVVNEANGTVNKRYSVNFSDALNQMNSYGSYVMYANDETGSVDIRNLIFYNQFTGESKKLLDEKLHIISFSIHYEFGDKPIIMYDIVKNDYNQDSLFDRNDPVMLYISDMNGNNFTQLTPEDETYLTFFYYGESGRMLLKVSKDGDKNLKFDPYDQTIFREVNLKKPAMGVTLFGDDMIEDLKGQI